MTATNATTNAILQFLFYEGHLAWRNNTTGVFDPRTKRFRPGPPSARGTGDIIGSFRGGRYFEVEIKTGKDRMSDNQMAHRDRVVAAGGTYIVAKTYDDFRNQYDQIMKGTK